MPHPPALIAQIESLLWCPCTGRAVAAKLMQKAATRRTAVGLAPARTQDFPALMRSDAVLIPPIFGPLEPIMAQAMGTSARKMETAP